MSDIEIIAEDQISTSRLGEVLKRAFIPFEIDNDGDLMVSIDNSRVFVNLFPGRHLVKYLMLFRFNDNVSEEQKFRFVNELNAKFVMVRFSFLDQKPEALWCEYFLPYEGGLTMHSFISALRLFRNVTVGTIQESDTDQLIA